MRTLGRARTALVAAVAVVVLTAAGACGGDDSDEPATPGGGQSAAASFPVTIEHKFGSTTIEKEPTRIVALSYEEDTLATLGITPVAYGKNEFKPDGAFPWLEGKIDLSGAAALDTFSELNLEQVAGLRPDLILATNFYGLEDYYDKLSEIAPTVAYGEEAGIATWQEVSTVIGKAVGREDDVAAAIADTEKKIADFGAALPGLKDKTYSYSYYYEPDGLAVIDDPETISVQLYSQLGMRLSPQVTENVVDRSLSMENIGALDADFLLIGFASAELRTELGANPLFAQIPAVVAGRVYQADAFTAGAVNNPTILNIPWQLAELRPTLEKVAAAQAG
ncbi:iron-siderophore ABC transporter substrate-binding protein [Frankia sp. CNm7]|uniref:Iron-siderophore ABC transporter substrate-binding protein n=1 Tax=Frankia nepalensis TaxID=1836974 RepID=A0A937RB02_9ACTN|nr:iron-siderophore ABC transporter substrate-binding protein [Frankia nepalensis]MBL7497665.1 iron-siderophore ABC transporter substrate-binding protein [Frankia nepalensis]MBL7513416.1 iron-siderophore ABC transporter substrate-binding protein [Frankia nepalensis]MBL7521263.1 iron-siderophore ABC transporter substrate-binding protein [Frankia nepalensis]MBL7627140.1 iron-siderophore ABC transporter substrate-binding protein [Frankia nepalensis]